MASKFVVWLLSLCLIQSIIIVHLVSRQSQHNQSADQHKEHGSDKMQQLADRYTGGRTCPACPVCAPATGMQAMQPMQPLASQVALPQLVAPAVGTVGSVGSIGGMGGMGSTGGTGGIGGVAVTLMLHSPTWFQRRYRYVAHTPSLPHTRTPHTAHTYFSSVHVHTHLTPLTIRVA
jgi:hypothetical protein